MSAILAPTIEAVPAKAYRLRWRFEFLNGKPTKTGVWDATSDLPQDSAWAVNKDGLAYAIIEGECRHTFEMKRLFVCEAAEYVSMQWEAYAKSPSLGLKPIHGAMKLRANIAGLSILTREEKVTCWVNGTISREQLSEHDKTWKIKEHSV
jgi:hypothetical protein